MDRRHRHRQKGAAAQFVSFIFKATCIPSVRTRLIDSERRIKMKGLLYAMIVLGLVGSCFGGTNRKCYSCVYHSLDSSDSSCEAPSASAAKTTCNGQCQKTYLETSGLITITRSCAPVCIEIGCAESSGTKACTTCCDSDLCNGAGSVTFNLVAMFTLITTAWGLSK